jgi:16S rRNA processing protein RimM
LKSSSKLIDRDDLVLVGRVTGAHGIRGDLKIHAYAESLQSYPAGGEIMLSLRDGSIRSLTLQWVKLHGRGFRMHLEGVDDRNRAEDLTGAGLFIDKSCLPELEADTYYWFELMGLSVFDTGGRLLGTLDAVIPTAANDVYVVKDNTPGHVRELLLPAVGAVVIDIDLAGRRMVVDPPEGL